MWMASTISRVTALRVYWKSLTDRYAACKEKFAFMLNDISVIRILLLSVIIILLLWPCSGLIPGKEPRILIFNK